MKLTSREQQVLNLIAEGITTAEIAAILFISTETVKTYRTELLYKFEARNVANLIYKAYEYIED